MYVIILNARPDTPELFVARLNTRYIPSRRHRSGAMPVAMAMAGFAGLKKVIIIALKLNKKQNESLKIWRNFGWIRTEYP
jgi:hypothetical protein